MLDYDFHIYLASVVVSARQSAQAKTQNVFDFRSPPGRVVHIIMKNTFVKHSDKIFVVHNL